MKKEENKDVKNATEETNDNIKENKVKSILEKPTLSTMRKNA